MRSQLPGITEYLGLDYPSTATALYRTQPGVFADAASLPLADGVFDTVLLLDVLEHLAEPEAALREAGRVLRPGGSVLITVPFCYPLHDQPHDYQRWTEHALRRRLAQAGFEVLELAEASDAHAAAGVTQALTLGQAAVEALSRPGWRLLGLPLLLAGIVLVNLQAWCLSRVWPVQGLMPGAYHLRARRPLAVQPAPMPASTATMLCSLAAPTECSFPAGGRQ